jgi:hypothetical protein
MLTLEQSINPLRLWMDATGLTYEELAEETGRSKDSVVKGASTPQFIGTY